MSTGTENHQTELGTPSFRDEIFQWPIAKLVTFDVWKLIEKYLTSPTDKKNLLVASPQFFGPLLAQEKCSTLLGEVLHILDKNNYLNLTKGKFLEYRTLSKSCKKSIDTCLQFDNPCFQNLDGIDHERRDPYSPPLRQHAICWNKPAHLSGLKMYQKIEDYSSMIRSGNHEFKGSCPFLCGHLVFSPWYIDSPRWALDGLREKFIIILRAVGSQIYHFSIECLCRRPWDVDELLCEFLGMMPNLQTLSFINLDTDSVSSDSTWPRFKQGNQLPKLRYLEVLKTKNAPIRLLKPLISKYGPQLKTLSVSSSHEMCEEYVHEKEIFSPAANLAALSLPLMSSKYSIGKYLRELLKQRTNLTCLSISIHMDLYDEPNVPTFQELTTTLCDLFQNGKLHTLNLFFHTYLSIPPDDVRLKLPTLKRLWIRTLHVRIFFSIDFILGCSDSLEELVLNMGCNNEPVNQGQTEIIQFVGCWKNMEGSNVWKLMPKLQKITIRHGYDSEKFYKEYITSRPSTLSVS